MANKETLITKDPSNRKLTIVREFDAPVDQVWRAWTEHELLDQWWAPKPWKAKTKSMDFREGGVWLYSMVGPDGTGEFCKVDYKTIVHKKSFSGMDAFCDENGNTTSKFPSMEWLCEFSSIAGGTRVDVNITFSSAADLEKIVEMGFKEGFTAAHSNLDELLAENVSV